MKNSARFLLTFLVILTLCLAFDKLIHSDATPIQEKNNPKIDQGSSMDQKLTLTQLDLKNKQVLMRVDFNVPLTSSGEISDDTRIRAALPSIRYILDQGASLVLMSHLGRPKGKIVPELSLQPCAEHLSKLLGRPVQFAPDCIGPETEELTSSLAAGQVVLLENLRFHTAETSPESDPSFVKQLAHHGDVYVNDAFGTAHRSHASTTAITEYFPGQSGSGFLLEKEIQFLGGALNQPKRPFFAIIGGAKVSSKLAIIKSLAKRTDALLIGGGMSYTFLKAQGFEVGDSLYEEECLSDALEIMATCKEKGVRLLLPTDIAIADDFSNDANSAVVTAEEGISSGWMGLGIGPATTERFCDALKEAKTVLWNGPLGVTEFENFAEGTRKVAEALAELSGTTIVGGGDSIAAINALGLGDRFSHMSTGGGASLEFIERGTLPGIEALSSVPQPQN
jgi:phosphoglycerate kinase